MTFHASNELALHVPDPATAEPFYVQVLGCTLFDRTPDCISLTNGALRLYLVRDPAHTHDAGPPDVATQHEGFRREYLGSQEKVGE